MKVRHIFTIIFLMFIGTILSLFFSDKNQQTNKVFLNEDMYSLYEIILDDGITIGEYKEIFESFKTVDYYISYIDTMGSDRKIDIGIQNYLDAIDIYIKNYVKTLSDEIMIAKVQSGNVLINKIVIKCTKDIYEVLKKETKVSKIYGINQ